MHRGKNYLESAKLIERSKQYDPAEAFDLVIKASKAKFDETVEAHIRLGVDSRHADQQVRGAVVLPNGTGKKVRVLVFAKGDNVNIALEKYFGAWESPFARLKSDTKLIPEKVVLNALPDGASWFKSNFMT